MNTEAVLEEIEALPIEKQEEVLDFVAFLRTRLTNIEGQLTGKGAEPTSFVGMWADRAEMRDSVAWVRRLREREWATPGV